MPSSPGVSLPSIIDPLVSLSFSIYGNSGVYALLLGSGISRSASMRMLGAPSASKSVSTALFK